MSHDLGVLASYAPRIGIIHHLIAIYLDRVPDSSCIAAGIREEAEDGTFRVSRTYDIAGRHPVCSDNNPGRSDLRHGWQRRPV